MEIHTSFRGKVIVRPEYIDLVKLICNGEWEKAEEEFPFIQEYTKIEMSKKIPITEREIAHAMAEDGFLYLRDHYGTWEDEEEYHTMLDGTVWTFIANLEDYKDKNNNNALPIQSFIEIILEKIVTDVVLLEEWYGDKDSPIQYVLTNTKIKCKK
ncbi:MULTISPECIES: hypothetical protein [Bacillus cereus group]|uniref:Uncharacterized protein n=2 Tax=Bacteria TaxID=2 RepID=A0A9X6R4Z6_BACTJ|nr:hypothetical protein [Bacillus thuringiensis]OUB76909.1 hypothetical protein BK750_03275 [Bacillus thuringiensis serovar jegathesan]